ncbi:hypothetical protein HN258_04850 [Acinetobacter baumannii]|uniref:hypothetical protein n=1 Tax=Acinetobacter baumannii TaxID=470 RepID=UPI001899843C|nr:hypothetical protein [Acinetobacter baumannii]MBF6687461.1 hypothetical protein [Acinetobacter baumannii]MBF6846171.1 hypothetical protein [Acinetobacter baumannii]MBF6916465.1 hypothetical protein [Acinetobacter baumannii]MBF6969304.1 hypothetical protein [Acinetobacter baumannii]
MKPEQFIREYGVEKAREIVAASANALVQCSDGTTFHVNDLKRLVESVELIEELGGINLVKDHGRKGGLYGGRVITAIADYESIYGGGQ